MAEQTVEDKAASVASLEAREKDLRMKEARRKMKEMFNTVWNVSSMRKRWLDGGIDDDPRRNVEDECGHPRLDEIYLPVENYRRMYMRDAIAGRVVEVYPKETWKVHPLIYEDDDPEVTTEFEKRVSDLPKMISKSKYCRDVSMGVLWSYMERWDISSRIGHYGLLLIGINDGLKLDQPARFEERTSNFLDITYLRVFPEYLCTNIEFEENPASPRHRQPKYYHLSFSNLPSEVDSDQASEIKKVHWSRVLHLVDGADSQEVYGTPSQRPVYNRLLDNKKVTGGSAEMYWKGAFPGLFIGTDPALGGDVDADFDAAKDEVELYQNGLQRVMAMVGFLVQQLAPQVVDPSPQIERQIEAVCIRINCPKRIFMGSERGELSSSQDEADWNSKIIARQNNHSTPHQIIPFFERCIMLGVLPPPKKGFAAWWPDITSRTASEKSAITFQLTQALAQYITSHAYLMMTPLDYFTVVWNLDEQVAKMLVAKVEKSEEYKKALAMATQMAAQAKAEASGQDDQGGKPPENQGMHGDNGVTSKTKKVIKDTTPGE